MMRGKKTLKIATRCKIEKIAKIQKHWQKIAIILKIAPNRGRNFPEGQVYTVDAPVGMS